MSIPQIMSEGPLVRLLQILALTINMWSTYIKEHRSKNTDSPATSPRKKFKTPSEEAQLELYNESLMGIQRRARYHWLTLIVEWDKRDQIKELLIGIENNQFFNKTMLNNALQVALENDRSENSTS